MRMTWARLGPCGEERLGSPRRQPIQSSDKRPRRPPFSCLSWGILGRRPEPRERGQGLASSQSLRQRGDNWRMGHWVWEDRLVNGLGQACLAKRS